MSPTAKIALKNRSLSTGRRDAHGALGRASEGCASRKAFGLLKGLVDKLVDHSLRASLE